MNHDAKYLGKGHFV